MHQVSGHESDGLHGEIGMKMQTSSSATIPAHHAEHARVQRQLSIGECPILFALPMVTCAMWT